MSRTYGSGSAFSGPDSYSSDYIYNLKLKTIMCYLDCNPNHYVTLEYAEHTYIKITAAELLYQPLSSMYNYLNVVDASDTYLQMTDASTTYLKIMDAPTNYLKIVDASTTYLKIVDASTNYLKIMDASTNYLKIVDASNNYLARTGIATSIATLTTFNNIWVQGFNLKKCINLGNLTIYIGINPTIPGVGNTPTIIGNNAYANGGSVAIGSSDQTTNTSGKTTYGVIIGFNSKSFYTYGYEGGNNFNIVIGTNSTDNSGYSSIILGSNTQITLPYDSLINKPAYAIGYGANATIFYQMMLGTSSETVYCPGNPSGGQTPNTCLVLSSNVSLNTLENTPPTNGQLGYQFQATINDFSNNLLTVQPFATFTSLPIGVWYITGSINLTQLSGSSDNVLLQYSLSTSSSTQDPKYGYLLSYCTINNIFGFNYNNIIINNTSSQTYYLVIQKTVSGSGFNYQSNTDASYLIATRIA